MRSALLLTILSVFVFASCKKQEKEKEKVGYEKVINNIYKSEDFLFHFIDSEKSHFYNIINNEVDSSTLYVVYYRVEGDSLRTNFLRGRILEDRLALRYLGDNEDIIFMKQ